ncbi:hypothetical protein ACNTMW_31370 [Planosporangium sp. 12N6]|uniref:hypothetical protein n=1 Tax=Planosporangium spinosum TaxID=3402278 RepID=UPI003CF9EAD6
MTAEVLDPEDDRPNPGGTAGHPDDTEPRPGADKPGVDKPGVGKDAVPARSTAEDQTERGLRGLVGGGSSQVSVAAALRARDAARPTDADLAAAEAELVIVRRGWVPREDLPPRGGARH